MKETVIFIPCFNEARRLNLTVFKEFISKENSIDFVFVDDGSTDETRQLLEQTVLKYSNCKLVNFDDNKGKGKALRLAMLQYLDQDYKLYGFIDGDLDIPLVQINRLKFNLIHSNYKIAISTRKLRLIKGSFLKWRSYASLIIVYIANKIINNSTRVNDTQCGCKLFKKEVILTCFADEFISSWLFDIEVFLRLKKIYPELGTKVIEVPINQRYYNANSKVKFSQNIIILWELYKIKSSYR